MIPSYCSPSNEVQTDREILTKALPSKIRNVVTENDKVSVW